MKPSAPLAAVILAAGKSTRMNLQPKAALPLAGRPMGQWVLEAVSATQPQKIVVVVGHQAERVKQAFGDGCRFVLQQPQLGTAHALLTAESALPGFSGNLLVVNADHPLLAREDLCRLTEQHLRSGADASLLTWRRTGDCAYGRILREEKGGIVGIVEEKDATAEELSIREVNLSIYCFSAPLIFDILRQIRADNAQREYYLTDTVALLVKAGKKVETVQAQSRGTSFGVNTRDEFARAEAFLLRGDSLE